MLFKLLKACHEHVENQMSPGHLLDVRGNPFVHQYMLVHPFLLNRLANLKDVESSSDFQAFNEVIKSQKILHCLSLALS